MVRTKFWIILPRQTRCWRMNEQVINKELPPVIADIEKWPIYQLSEDRDAFIRELNTFTLNRIMKSRTDMVQDMIAKTIYLELIRIKEEPWKVDPPNEKQYWNRIKSSLVKRSLDKEDEAAKANTEEILYRIIGRYSEEIVGTFNIKTFLFARKFLTIFFHRLLNTAASRNFKRFYGTRFQVYERFKVRGSVDVIRNLFSKGTVVVVPTHFSNLDSILIGYVMDAVLGLPSFSYGAGLNLYNTGYTAYFMNRLGAYRIDRRKKNPIYLETLKAMSNLSIQRGTNSLFFPGGTRSRSGSIETRLKLGMLGTTVEAQRVMCDKDADNKVFIVPLIMSYPVVLEARQLIDQHLKKTGKEQYIEAGYSRRKVLKFIWKLFSEKADMTLSFGRPMDVLGNFVDAEGQSFDRHGNKIDIKDYFLTDGKVTADLQRETEYTRILSERIVRRFHRENIVLSSHLLAFTVFNLLTHSNLNLDLYGLLRLPSEDHVFEKSVVEAAVEKMRDQLIELKENGGIKLSKEIYYDIPKLIEHGIRSIGNFHAQKALSIQKSGDIVSEDFKLLYYYHNRLDNYDLHKKIDWGKLIDKKVLAAVAVK